MGDRETCMYCSIPEGRRQSGQPAVTVRRLSLHEVANLDQLGPEWASSALSCRLVTGPGEGYA